MMYYNPYNFFLGWKAVVSIIPMFVLKRRLFKKKIKVFLEAEKKLITQWERNEARVSKKHYLKTKLNSKLDF